MEFYKSSIKLGASFEVFYTEAETLQSYQDVQFISLDGKKHGINRSVLAAGSKVCLDLLRNHYTSCPIANSDDVSYISTNLTNQELSTLISFLTKGTVPIGLPAASTKVLFEMFSLKADMGLNSSSPKL